MISRIWLVWVSIIGLVTLLAAGYTTGSSRPAEQQPSKVSVTIDNFNYGLATLTIAVGTTVIWTNQDDVPHTVTSNDNVFGSPVLDTGEKFEFTFKKVGTFPYYCKVHPKMTAKVVVQ